MRDQLWFLLYRVKYTTFYLPRYKALLRALTITLDVISAAASAASIAAWSFWQSHAVLWSVIIGLSQLIQLITPHLPFTHLIQGIIYAVPDLEQLAIDIELAFEPVYRDPSLDCSEQYEQLSARFVQIKSKFIEEQVLDLSLIAKPSQRDLEHALSFYSQGSEQK